MERGRSSGRSWLICCFETAACTTAESVKPRIRGQRISHPMASAIPSARMTASIIRRSCALTYSFSDGGKHCGIKWSAETPDNNRLHRGARSLWRAGKSGFRAGAPNRDDAQESGLERLTRQCEYRQVRPHCRIIPAQIERLPKDLGLLGSATNSISGGFLLRLPRLEPLS